MRDEAINWNFPPEQRSAFHSRFEQALLQLHTWNCRNVASAQSSIPSGL